MMDDDFSRSPARDSDWLPDWLAADPAADLGAEQRRKSIHDPRRWSRCRWPHQLLTPESEAKLTAAIAAHRPYAHRVALSLADYDHLLAADLEQHALLLLWEWGWQRIESTPPPRVRRAVLLRMRTARRSEHRALGGARRVRVELRTG